MKQENEEDLREHINNFKGWDELLKRKYVDNIEKTLQ